MANPTGAFGLRPVRYAWGGVYTGHANPYYATGASGAIYVGDPVLIAGTSNAAALQGYPAGSLMQCSVALDGDGDPIYGVCVGVLPVTRDSTLYREDSTDRIIMVADDPDLVFEGRLVSTGTAWAVTDTHSYANLITGSGNNVSGISGWYLATADGPDTSDVSNQLLALRVSPRVGNAVGASAVWEVMINNHGYTPGGISDAGRFAGL